MTRSSTSGHRLGAHLKAMTLVEILIATAVAAIVLAGVLAVVISLARTAVKNMRMERTAALARSIQEIITQELNSAINIYDDDPAIRNRPSFANSNGGSPASYRQITYRAPVGPPGRLNSALSIYSQTVTCFAYAALKPQVGDYLILDTPKLGRGILISGVSDTRAANTDGDITITLSTSIDAGTVAGTNNAGPSHIDNVPAKSRVEIQRERAFIADAPLPGSATTTLRYLENTSNGSSRTLTDLLPASSSYLFRQVTSATDPREIAISWFLVLLDTSSSSGLTGDTLFFSSSSVGGTTGATSSLIIPKSGNGLTLSNPFEAKSTSISTTTTSTSSTKSTSTSTTSKSTTKTTSASTTKTTSNSTTKTTAASTTKTTSNSTTKTTSASTTSKATSTPTTSTSTTTTKSTIPFDG